MNFFSLPEKCLRFSRLLLCSRRFLKYSSCCSTSVSLTVNMCRTIIQRCCSTAQQSMLRIKLWSSSAMPNARPTAREQCQSWTHKSAINNAVKQSIVNRGVVSALASRTSQRRKFHPSNVSPASTTVSMTPIVRLFRNVVTLVAGPSVWMHWAFVKMPCCRQYRKF